LSKVNKQAIGVKGLKQFNGNVDEEFIRDLQYPYAANVYQEMYKNDSTVHSIIFMIEQLIRQTDWKVKPVSDSKEDLQESEFLESCMHDMDVSWSEAVQEFITMFVYGFSFHEILYKVRTGKNGNDKFNSKFSDGKIGWRGMPIRSQHTLDRWEFDGNGNVLGFHQADGKGNFYYIPMEKGLLFRTKRERGNPEGESLLRGAYRAWHFKKNIEEIEGIGIERDLAGMPMITPAPEDDIWNPEDEVSQHKLQMAQDLVKNVKRDSIDGIVKPNGWEFELVSSSGNRQFDTNQIINRYDQRIAITLLSDIVLLGSDKVGSFALANIKKSLLSLAIESQLQNIADIINTKAVPKLFELNGMEMEQYPEIVPHPVETPSVDEITSFLSAVGTSDMVMFPDSKVENYIRKLVSMPEKEYSQDDLEKEKEIREKKAENLTKDPKKNIDDNRNSQKETDKDTKERRK